MIARFIFLPRFIWSSIEKFREIQANEFYERLQKELYAVAE
jgi:hypothetical protein